MKLQELKKLFNKIYGDNNEEIYSFHAPGRVNLIGEHTDYNGGNVFPCALKFGTYAVARKRDDDKVRVYSKNFEDRGIIEFSLNELVYNKEHDWANYPKGVISLFIQNEYKIDKGMEVIFYGDIPNGAGLSSSASVELVTSVMLKKIFDLDPDMISMVEMSQKAENEFVGVNCGIMDQFAIGMGKEDKAILLDCDSLEYRYCDIKLKDASLIIANTNKRRGLADSAYNKRRTECENSLKQLQQKLDIHSLGELSEEQFEENKYLITNEIEQRRAKHAVYENQRTIKAVDALEKGDLQEFGRLMKESHISLRDDYEVTGKELDTLVEIAWKQKGVIGARMTGAGFGGCTVSIVKDDEIDNFIENVGKEYKEKIGYKADFYVVGIGDGARQID